MHEDDIVEDCFADAEEHGYFGVDVAAFLAYVGGVALRVHGLD